MMSEEHDGHANCCLPGRDSATGPEGSSKLDPAVSSDPNLVALDGGSFTMGAEDDVGFPSDGEGPARRVSIEPFRISRFSVTNSQFRGFVNETGYRTEAEEFDWSFVFAGFLPDGFPPTRAVAQAQWWRQVYGADWTHPEGPESSIEGRENHPVVHVSWNDAEAFCQWAGVRLPTEAEWEYAARGGLENKRYVWGDDFSPGGETMCNIFEGVFPTRNTAEDGFAGTAPVDVFPPNGYGLHNMAGNVREWCDDWFSTSFHQDSSKDNPRGPQEGTERVTRGGSYLCHDSYCNRYRVAARGRNTPDSSTGNLGFRVAGNVIV